MPATNSGRVSASESKSMPKFLTIFTGQAFSLFGSRLVQFALVWWLTKTTGSASVLALASIVALLPQVFLMPLAGTLVDRWSRRAVMIVADAIIASAVVVLAVLYAQNAVQVWHVYALMFVRSAAGSFHWPAMQASTTLMVPMRHLSRIAGLNQTLFGAANIVAPPLGALLLEVLPMQNILAIDVSTAAVAITPLLFIAIPQPPIEDTAEGVRPSVLQDMRKGLRYLVASRGLFMVGIMAMLINFMISPSSTLMPILVTKEFGGGALEFAGLQSALGVGVVLGGLALSVWGGFKRRIVTALLGIVVMGVGIIVVGLTPANLFLLAMAALFSVGVANSMANASIQAVLQATVPPGIQGRVFTLVGSLSTGMTPIGLAIAGPVADALGVRMWYLIGGVGMLVMGTLAFFVPAIMRIEDEDPGEPANG